MPSGQRVRPFAGQTKVAGPGRPALRRAAWRAVWAALPHNAVCAARYHHLTGRADNPLKDGQVRAAIAGALLRQLFVVVTRRGAWDPAIASEERHEAVVDQAA